MTTTTHPSGLPEQEPTSPTAVVLCGDESWVNTAMGWESLTQWLGAWGDLRDFAARNGGATLLDLAGIPVPATTTGERITGELVVPADTYDARHSEWRPAYGPLVVVVVRDAAGAAAGHAATTTAAPF